VTALLEENSVDYALGPLSQIPPGEGREFLVGGRQVAVFHARSGAVYATQAFCPHREGPLSDGLLGGSILACPLHSWKFNLATGDTLNGDCGITTYPVRLDEEAQIVLTLVL
jgi:nitrite reductase (NADH) small subunit